MVRPTFSRRELLLGMVSLTACKRASKRYELVYYYIPH